MLHRSASGGNRSVSSVGGGSVVSVATKSNSRRSRSIPRIYGPRDLEDEFLRGDLEKESKPVIAKIARCYSRLKHQKFGYGGFCFGLLDPTSNIYVNSFMSPVEAAWEADGGEQTADMVQRSLHGLRAFLTCLFAYLPDVEALRYLDAADADPLVASLLIINRRGIEQSFRIDSGATVAAIEVALRCAAVAARHPDPQKLVLGWKLVSPNLKKLLPKLQSDLEVLILSAKMKAPGTSALVLELQESWELAKSRLHRAKPQFLLHRAKPQVLPPARSARKHVLIAIIYRFYLMALAKLPKDELCSRYHHSLLKAGHCYGPLDPVSNIIVNTVWYDKAFPPDKQVTIHMINTRCLRRIVARSFYGLVSFMCTRYPDRTIDQVLQCLQVANADLRVADPTLCDMAVARPRRRDSSLSFSGNLSEVASSRGLAYETARRSVGESTTLPSLQSAYMAAATAALHPVPHEQQAILGSPDSLLKLQVANMQVLHKDVMLSSKKVEFLASLLMSPIADENYQQPQPEPKKVDKSDYIEFSHRCREFWWQHDRVQMMVEVALAKFNRNKVHKYRLHFICGVNERVSGPEYNTTKGNPDVYHHTHVNFLVTSEDPQSSHDPAMLFFAECGQYSTKESWCFPVNPQDQDTEHVRCIYCEKQGIPIVHPAVKSFHGRDREFDKVLREEPLFPGSGNHTYNNNYLFTGHAPDMDTLNRLLPGDFMYFDYALDPDAKEISFPYVFMTEK